MGWLPAAVVAEVMGGASLTHPTLATIAISGKTSATKTFSLYFYFLLN
jgi:hypothetical protein